MQEVRRRGGGAGTPVLKSSGTQQVLEDCGLSLRAQRYSRSGHPAVKPQVVNSEDAAEGGYRKTMAGHTPLDHGRRVAV